MPTSNPVPSSDPSDLLFNAAKLDEVINSTSQNYTDRLGVIRRTLIGLESEYPDAAANAALAAASEEASRISAAEANSSRDAAIAASDVAQLSAGVYATTAAGLAATTSGKYFSVPSADSSEYLILYINSSGSAVEIKRYPSANAVYAINDRVTVIEYKTDPLPVNYVQNFLGNGDLAITPPAWTYTGTSPIVSASGIAELANLGIDRAYSIPTAGGTASQARIESSLLAGIGILAGEHILIGSFVYASDGASFPTSFSSYSITVSGVTLGMDSTGFVQVSTNVRFLWAKKLIPAGSLTRIVIGFLSSALPASAATRLHSGFFVHKSASSADTPTIGTIDRYLGWGGNTSSSELFGTLQAVADEYTAGTLGVGNYEPRLVLAGPGNTESYIEVRSQGKTIRRTFRPFPVASKTASSVFDFRDDIIDGVAIKLSTDDAAPYRALGTTIGANHGYYMFSVPAAGHGKTQADIGSVYANGGIEWVIIDIISASSLYIARRSDNASTVAPAGVYTHVSGGANFGNITVTASGTLAQLYPPFVNRSIRCIVDGVLISETTANMTYRREVAFVESYDIIERADVIAWYEASGASGQVQPDGDPAISVSISYVFDHEGQCTIYTDFLARKSVALQDIMFVMAARMTPTDGVVRYYIPKSLPLTHESSSYNYSLIDSSDTSSWATRLDMTPDRCEPTGILCDRLVQLSNNYGFALGYLPLQSASVATRRSNATVKALQISNSSGKVYLSAIDKGDITLSAGNYFSAVAYRNIVLRDSARTSLYSVRTNGADYLYADWHATTIDKIPVPTDFVGRDFEIVEKSPNVSVLSQALTSNLIVSVNAAGSYGYLIIKVL